MRELDVMDVTGFQDGMHSGAGFGHGDGQASPPAQLGPGIQGGPQPRGGRQPAADRTAEPVVGVVEACRRLGQVDRRLLHASPRRELDRRRGRAYPARSVQDGAPDGLGMPAEWNGEMNDGAAIASQPQ